MSARSRGRGRGLARDARSEDRAGRRAWQAAWRRAGADCGLEARDNETAARVPRARMGLGGVGADGGEEPFLYVPNNKRTQRPIPKEACLRSRPATTHQAVPTDQLSRKAFAFPYAGMGCWVCVVSALRPLRPRPARRQLQKESLPMASLESISFAALAIFWSSQVKRSFSYSHERSKGRMSVWPTMMSAVFLRRLKTLCCT